MAWLERPVLHPAHNLQIQYSGKVSLRAGFLYASWDVVPICGAIFYETWNFVRNSENMDPIFEEQGWVKGDKR